VKTTECSLGALLRQTRMKQGLSLRQVAFSARLSPIYLSLLERDACGPPSDEKLQALIEALGEPHGEIFFAKAGRAHPRAVDIILQHPSKWTELLKAGEDLDSDHIESLKTIVNGTPGVAKTLAILHIIRAATQQAQAEASKNIAEPSLTLSAIAAIQQALSAKVSENLEPVLSDGKAKVQFVNPPAEVGDRQAQAEATKNLAERSTVPVAGMPAWLSAIAAIQQAPSADISENLEPVLSDGKAKVQFVNLPAEVGDRFGDVAFNARFPELLRRARQEAGLSIRQLAERSAIDATHLSRLERGLVPPPTSPTMSAIARELPTSALAIELEKWGGKSLRGAVRDSANRTLQLLLSLPQENLEDRTWSAEVLKSLESCIAVLGSGDKQAKDEKKILRTSRPANRIQTPLGD
jgi:transcriptional regulator with XRE-family HTH domain